jgi:Ribbon-helix-helix protein, copG family
MKKTSIYLDDELDRLLALRAAEDGVTKAEYIRRGLATLANRPQRPRISVGIFDSGLGDLARNHDKYLAESDFGTSDR